MPVLVVVLQPGIMIMMALETTITVEHMFLLPEILVLNTDLKKSLLLYLLMPDLKLDQDIMMTTTLVSM